MGNNPIELAKKSDVTNHINNKNNPHQVKANQVIIGDVVSTELELEVGSNVDDALVTLNNTFEMINNSINGSDQNVTYWKMYEDDIEYTVSNIERTSSSSSVRLNLTFYRNCTYNRDTKEYNLSNEAGSYTFTYTNNPEDFKTVLNQYKNCYFETNMHDTGSNIIIAKITEDTYFDAYRYSSNFHIRLYKVSVPNHKFKYMGSVSDPDPSKYPNNAYSGDIYYIRQDGLSLTISKTMYSTIQTTSANTAEIICEFSPKILILQNRNGNNVFFWIYGSNYLTTNSTQAASINYESGTKTIKLTNMNNSLLNKAFNLVVIG